MFGRDFEKRVLKNCDFDKIWYFVGIFISGGCLLMFIISLNNIAITFWGRSAHQIPFQYGFMLWFCLEMLIFYPGSTYLWRWVSWGGGIYWVPQWLYDFWPSVCIQWQLLVICRKIQINFFSLTPPPNESTKCEKDSDLVSISQWKGQNNLVPNSLSKETFR